ncbi:hypothetical protein [Bosea sp. Root483D1]|uniref:hypothetical protein n=1 Tax=Bosea sp. Root483D1 TaxID=1736544 RepID=UPI0012E39022|nr:hypothetical protein [Bosea sp. Root483D1]
MPFSSLNDPVEVARARAALDSAWNEIRLSLSDPSDERERVRLAYIVAHLVLIAEDDDDLTRRAIERFRRAKAS